VIQGERSILDILTEGPGGVLVVPGSSGISKLADLGPEARKNVLDGLEELQQEAAFIVIDTMAGIGQNSIAFAAAADEVLLITTPEPSAIVDAYATAKTIFQVREDAVIRLVVNLVINEQQARLVAGKLQHVAQAYLKQKLHYFGYIPRDPHVSRAVMQSYPLLLRFPGAAASQAIEELALRVRNEPVRREKGLPGFIRRFAQNLGLASTA